MFYVTFGQMYRNETHPRFPNVNPDGVVVVEAEDYFEARKIVFDHFGQHFCSVYEEEEVPKKFYHLGIIGKATKDSVEWLDEREL